MDDSERTQAMISSLRLTEDHINRTMIRLRTERHDQTQRGLIYLEDGLELLALLGAMGISERTWYRRVKELRERYSANLHGDGPGL